MAPGLRFLPNIARPSYRQPVRWPPRRSVMLLHRREPVPVCAVLVLPLPAAFRRSYPLLSDGKWTLSCGEARQPVPGDTREQQMFRRVFGRPLSFFCLVFSPY
jgi:hypothetical protein